MYHDIYLFMHHIDGYFYIVFVLTCSLPLNLSVHSYDANTLVKSWVRGVGYTITPLVVANALGVPMVRDLVL